MKPTQQLQLSISLFDAMNANGGGTFTLGKFGEVVAPTRGLCVGIGGGAEFGAVDSFLQFLPVVEDLVNEGAETFGVWKDTQTGTIYLEGVKLFPQDDEAGARALCVERGEIAYFDLENMKEIRL